MKKFICSTSIIVALCATTIALASESFGGFGISIHPGKKGASIASVLPNSPAAQAGLQPGDVIISVNGTLLSSVAPENQISLLRGNAGSSVSLQVSRNGEIISLLAKRASISVQDLKSSDVSAWFGKSKSLTLEELNFLASQKVGEGYELLGVMQKGLLVNVKGAVVWQKNLGKLPTGTNNVDWNGTNLPAGSYHAMLQAGSAALVQKFELR